MAEAAGREAGRSQEHARGGEGKEKVGRKRAGQPIRAGPGRAAANEGGARAGRRVRPGCISLKIILNM